MATQVVDKNELEQLFKLIVNSVTTEWATKKINEDKLNCKDIANKSETLRVTGRFSAAAHDRIETLFGAIDNMSELWHAGDKNYSHDMLDLIKSVFDAKQERKLLHAVWGNLPNGTYALALKELFFNEFATLNDMALSFEFCVDVDRKTAKHFMDTVETEIKKGNFEANEYYIYEGMFKLACYNVNLSPDDNKYLQECSMQLCDKYFPKAKRRLLMLSEVRVAPKSKIVAQQQIYTK